ncbi:WD40 repeat-like protein [Linderina pennispora]|uniref:Elongator complex protein 2 n=1 Tax=Linderina pennispora TaxID=61395 RepID=A0A1Y1WDL1_9FUNG|nr:WD40 repeat-like protein [Linderina pennispora]ORX71254.1 WD40 repeat-like protein [Linderina pennispora]
MADAHTEFIGCGCNRTPHALDWHGSLVAFGSYHYVALYDPSSLLGVHTTLHGHSGRVNCVKFARTLAGQSTGVIISGSADSTARVWEQRDGEWIGTELAGHTNPVISTTGICAGDFMVVATAATDGTVRVYEYKDFSADLVEIIEIGSRNALDVTLAALETGESHALVLATGNTDSCVHIYTRLAARGSGFKKSLTLSGHEDWVTSLSFLSYRPRSAASNSTIAHWQSGDVILASGSEDKYIRLWRITAAQAMESDKSTSDKQAAQAMLDAFSRSLGSGLSDGDITANVLASTQLSTRKHAITVESGSQAFAFSVSLDSVLMGHDGWVNSVAWNGGGQTGPLLVSASLDSSVLVWHPDPDAGVWGSVARLGEVGGSAQGFLGAAMKDDGSALLAHGYHGSFHMWQQPDRVASEALWQPTPSLSGHYGSVQDVLWDPTGSYLLTVSLDQTSRLVAPWISDRAEHRGWHEIARPQVHGYDMRCAAFTSPFQYVSGADEKVVRVFQATQQFVTGWRSVSHPSIEASEQERSLPVGASLPLLGLSNKAVEEDQVKAAQQVAQGEAEERGEFETRQTHVTAQAAASLQQYTGVPTEEQLLQHTLWPEQDKLYGHPYEIFAVAAARSGKWIATSCKAAAEKHAGIRLFSTGTWRQPGAGLPLHAHALTITRLRFSPIADKFLLSVSRDRSWAVYESTGKDDEPYRLLCRHPKAHARIIWDCAWAPDARFFVTASRDKTVKVWAVPKDKADGKPVTIVFPDAVTAIDVLPARIGGQYAMAVGLEGGRVFVLTSEATEDAVPAAWTPKEVPRNQAHTATVQRLSWRPNPTEADGRAWLLASGSDDQSVRILTITL